MRMGCWYLMCASERVTQNNIDRTQIDLDKCVALGQCQTCGCNWCGRKRASRLAHSREGSRDPAFAPSPSPRPPMLLALESAWPLLLTVARKPHSQPFSVTQCIAQCNRFRLHSALHSATVFGYTVHCTVQPFSLHSAIVNVAKVLGFCTFYIFCDCTVQLFSLHCASHLV